MMKFFMIFVVLSLVNSEFTSFRWKSCVTDRAHQALRVNFFTMSPMPFLFPGKLHISFYANVIQRIDLAILDFNVTRLTVLGAAIHVPSVYGGIFGSCQVDRRSMLDDVENERCLLGRIFKAMFNSIGLFSGWHVPKQHVAISNYTFDLPKPSSAIGFILDGDYNVRVNVKDPLTTHSLGCFEFNTSIKRNESHTGFLFG